MSSELVQQLKSIVPQIVPLTYQRISVDEKKQKKVQKQNQYYLSLYSLDSPCGKVKTNKQGQPASKRLVRLCVRTAEGFISGATGCSLNLKHRLHSHTGCAQSLPHEPDVNDDEGNSAEAIVPN